MMEAMLRRRAGAQTMDERAATCRDLGARRPRGRRARRQCGTSRRSAILVHRYYDPATGSFLSVDPDAEQTQQPYVYVDDDSVNATDPSGLCWSLLPGSMARVLPPPPGVLTQVHSLQMRLLNTPRLSEE